MYNGLSAYMHAITPLYKPSGVAFRGAQRTMDRLRICADRIWFAVQIAFSKLEPRNTRWRRTAYHLPSAHIRRQTMVPSAI